MSKWEKHRERWKGGAGLQGHKQDKSQAWMSCLQECGICGATIH